MAIIEVLVGNSQLSQEISRENCETGSGQKGHQDTHTPGILFLTANQVGTCDKSFKSRIHVSLYYPPLNRDQTIEVFKVNIRKLKKIIHNNEKLNAKLDFATSAERPQLAIDPRSILHYAA
ncbi:hypothetical protein F5X97DRAFT_318327 [Nemania serpens]|nr:hypothetical protein F5X97DRAFT_318327 [Nemania serpens]